MSALDAYVREIAAWHLSEETGTPLWIRLAKEAGVGPRDIQGFDDLTHLPRFEDAWLRDLPHSELIPRGLSGRPYAVFETGGTTGRPKQRLSWRDHALDYERFSEALDPEAFPMGASWLMVGPTGPRRLRLTIEHLANHRGGPCYHVDCDPRWAKRLAREGRHAEARAYTQHVVDQALNVLGHRPIQCLFTTPTLLEAIGEAIDLSTLGIRGVFCGGTSMSAQTLRFLLEEVLGPNTQLLPTYGNTLMGLAIGLPVSAEAGYRPRYYPPLPRAILRVVDPEAPERLVDYDAWGRVELTTLTRELFLPRHLERDEGVRIRPCDAYPFDGVADVRPLGTGKGEVSVEGVY